MLRFFKTITFFGIFVVVVVSILHLGAFFLLNNNSSKRKPQSLVIVHPGLKTKERAEAAFRLVQELDQPSIALIGHQPKHIHQMNKNRFDLTGVQVLECGKSRSTFEDVFFAHQLMEAGGFDSIIQVTSRYHMPRALFLMKLYNFLAGDGATVYFHIVEDQSERDEWYSAKLLINENIKLWGSLVEIGLYFGTKSLPLDYPLGKEILAFVDKWMVLKL